VVAPIVIDITAAMLREWKLKRHIGELEKAASREEAELRARYEQAEKDGIPLDELGMIAREQVVTLREYREAIEWTISEYWETQARRHGIILPPTSDEGIWEMSKYDVSYRLTPRGLRLIISEVKAEAARKLNVWLGIGGIIVAILSLLKDLLAAALKG
jgi:hypothetical protein